MNVIIWSARLILALILTLTAYGKVAKQELQHNQPVATHEVSTQQMTLPIAVSPSAKINIATPAVSTGSILTDVLSTAINAGKFKTLVALIQTAGLTDVLRSQRSVTLLAPTDEAFARLPQLLSADTLRKPTKRKTLLHLLSYHILNRKVTALDLQTVKSVKTMNGKHVQISLNKTVLLINNVQVLISDIQATNGVIHVIDAVLLPPKSSAIGQIFAHFANSAVTNGI